MAEVSTEKFLQCYGNLLVQAWGMPALMERLKADPKAVLKEFGLDAGDSKVNYLVPGQPNNLSITEPSAESQAELWNHGLTAGEIDLYIPDSPPEDAGSTELSDEELMEVAGGWSISCCCCSPCCC